MCRWRVSTISAFQHYNAIVASCTARELYYSNVREGNQEAKVAIPEHQILMMRIAIQCVDKRRDEPIF